MWIIISIILAINSMWLLKLNKDLIERNEELIARNIANSLTNEDIQIPIKPLTDKQKEMVDRWIDDSEEDK
ncbi:hypothetical protein [Mammaliicoccus sciuri]|uniref:Uncharacterized protein n=1 Tax=Mammaliicoccus sciuri TaxID=1296 RepID=A0ABT7HVP9_MAMSC|nr:hypothetical protein [Mammaliicoccus sciuri]MDL0112340.1 hypothetical protein [Mammaliicoccus sciuri]MDL0116226.1 hypothetical protein [Mammaliicoccus sciuri]